MDSRKFIYRETLHLAIGEMTLVAVMLGVFALLKEFDITVLIGGLAGGLLTIANFFVMAFNAVTASDKAVKQDVNGGRALMHTSYILRYVVVFAVLAVLAKTGVANPIACVLPLVFIQPVMILKEYFKKKVG